MVSWVSLDIRSNTQVVEKHVHLNLIEACTVMSCKTNVYLEEILSFWWDPWDCSEAQWCCGLNANVSMLICSLFYDSDGVYECVNHISWQSIQYLDKEYHQSQRDPRYFSPYRNGGQSPTSTASRHEKHPISTLPVWVHIDLPSYTSAHSAVQVPNVYSRQQWD